VREGAFYGWPWYYIGANEDPRHRGERPDLKDKITVPDCSSRRIPRRCK
jgi:glucose/arabinose dehydrogenase